VFRHYVKNTNGRKKSFKNLLNFVKVRKQVHVFERVDGDQRTIFDRLSQMMQRMGERLTVRVQEVDCACELVDKKVKKQLKIGKLTEPGMTIKQKRFRTEMRKSSFTRCSRQRLQPMAEARCVTCLETKPSQATKKDVRWFAKRLVPVLNRGSVRLTVTRRHFDQGS